MKKRAPRKHLLKMQCIPTVFNSFRLLINTPLVSRKAWLREKFSDRNNCMSFMAIVFQNNYKVSVWGKKAGEQGKKCKALCLQLVFRDMGGLLLKASKVFIYYENPVLWAPAKCLGAQQLSKTQITDSNLPPTSSPASLKNRKSHCARMRPSSLQPCCTLGRALCETSHKRETLKAGA